MHYCAVDGFDVDVGVGIGSTQDYAQMRMPRLPVGEQLGHEHWDYGLCVGHSAKTMMPPLSDGEPVPFGDRACFRNIVYQQVGGSFVLAELTRVV